MTSADIAERLDAIEAEQKLQAAALDELYRSSGWRYGAHNPDCTCAACHD